MLDTRTPMLNKGMPRNAGRFAVGSAGLGFIASTKATRKIAAGRMVD